MKISGAKAIVECLIEQGVDTIFGYPGGMILPLYDALHDTSKLKHVLTVHEQGAAHAADGYARASGRVGVCIATSGPGATNLLTGLAAAFMDSVPVIAITGQVPTSVIGTDAFQEVDIIGMSMPVTKHNFLVRDLRRLPEIIRSAFRIARTGRPGPVLIDIPRDIQTGEFEFNSIPVTLMESQAFASNDDLIAEAAQAIYKAKRPVVVIGGGVISAGAYAQVHSLVEKCSLPVVSTLMGLGGFPCSHPQMLGLTGLHGHIVANNTVHNADVVIAIGSRFSDRVTGNRTQYADEKLVIHIDADPAEIDKNVLTHLGLAGDIRTILAHLSALVQAGDTAAWWECIRKWKDEFAYTYSDVFEPPNIMHVMAEQARNQEAVFVTDVGQHQMWAAQHLCIEQPRTWLTSGGLGAMGFGLPAAMGAQFAVPHKKVIHIAGDGGMKMTGNELYTIATHNLPIISVIINNNSLGMIKQLQHVFYDKKYYSCSLSPNVDFALYAKSFGVNGVATNTVAEFAQAFGSALKSDQPEVIVANVISDTMVTPMVYPNSRVNNYVVF